MIYKVKPSRVIWDYYDNRPTITLDLIYTSIADKIAGYAISYSARELLKDLGYLTEKNNINKKGKVLLAHHLHDYYHRGKSSVILVSPYTPGSEE